MVTNGAAAVWTAPGKWPSSVADTQLVLIGNSSPISVTLEVGDIVGAVLEPQGGPSSDHWVQEGHGVWRRIHRVPRVALFTPTGTADLQDAGPVKFAASCVTEAKFADGSSLHVEDDWTGADGHRVLKAPWTGSTTFKTKTPVGPDVAHIYQDSDELQDVVELECPPDLYYSRLKSWYPKEYPGASATVLEHLVELERLLDVAIASGFSFGAAKSKDRLCQEALEAHRA